MEVQWTLFHIFLGLWHWIVCNLVILNGITLNHIFSNFLNLCDFDKYSDLKSKSFLLQEHNENGILKNTSCKKELKLSFKITMILIYINLRW